MVVSFLIMSALFLTAKVDGAQVSPKTGIQVHPSLTIGIKQFGVAGPVVGSNYTFGIVQLTAPAPPSGITVMLSSSLPSIATVPASVTVAPGSSDYSFQVATFPVSTQTPVTISAWTGADIKTANFVVAPPGLAILGCNPNSLSGGETTTCTVWLNGAVSGGRGQGGLGAGGSSGAVVALASTDGALVPSYVTVLPGQKTGSFQVKAGSLPQSAPVTISASYQGVTKTATVTVLPVAIKYLGCVVGSSISESSSASSQCEVIGGNFLHSYPFTQSVKVGIIVRLTAPAPAGGLKINLLVNSGSNLVPGILVPAGILVPEGKNSQFFEIYTKPIAEKTPFTISGFDPITHDAKTVTISVLPPSLGKLSFGSGESTSSSVSNVPLYGKAVTMRMVLNAPAPHGGMHNTAVPRMSKARLRPRFQKERDTAISRSLYLPVALIHPARWS